MHPSGHSGDGLVRPSSTASTASLHARRSSHDVRDSQASSASATSTGQLPAHTQSISFATPDHGVVSVNLADLSNALGVRRGDVVSQRMFFQARSAPSHRVDRSLLGSALGTTGLLGGDGGGGGPTFSPTADLEAASAAVAAVSRSRDELRGASVTPPPAPPGRQYQRRSSTLRGTQVEGDASAPQALASAAVGLPPLSSLLRPPPRRGTPPPPGGASALRRALAGDRSAPFAAGSVPSPLRFAGGLLSRSGPAYPSLSSSHRSGGRRGLAREEAEREEQARHGSDSDGEEEESVGLLTSGRGDALARAVQGGRWMLSADPSEHRDRLIIPGRRSSSSTAASRSSGTPIPPPPPPALCNDEDDETGAAATAASPSRSVHFSENVIESVSHARGEDEYMHLLVVYSRPWYAYVLFAVFGALGGLSFLSAVYLERNQPRLKDRATSVPFLLFLVSLMGTVGMSVHLAISWRPDSEEEQGFFERHDQRSQLPQLWSLAFLVAAALTLALVVSHAIGCTVTVVMVVALVGHLLAERVRGEAEGECVTCWDVSGSVVAALGALLTVSSGAVRELLGRSETLNVVDGLLVLLGWGVSVLVAGVCWTVFTRQLRAMSQRVSQQFLLTTSLAVCTVALGIGAFVADTVLSSDGAVPSALLNGSTEDALRRNSTTTASSPVPTAVLVPCYSIFPDLIILLGGGLSFLLSWYAYHTVSFLVDHIAGAACMVIGSAVATSPLLLILAVRSGPSLSSEMWVLVMSLSVAGMLALVVGAGMVVYGGVRCRREVEIRIVVE